MYMSNQISCQLGSHYHRNEPIIGAVDLGVTETIASERLSEVRQILGVSNT